MESACPNQLNGRTAAPSPGVQASRRPGVEIPGLYLKLLTAARAAVARGDSRAIEDPDGTDDARHGPASAVVKQALADLAKLERGDPVVVTPDDVVRPAGD
jgi:hypothetical protein